MQMRQRQKYQRQQYKKFPWKRLLLISVIFLLIFVSVVLIIIGNNRWTIILSTILTTLSVIFATAQWLIPMTPKSSNDSPLSSSIPFEDQAYSLLLKQIETEILTDQSKGAVIIYTIPEMLNKQVEILDLQTQAQVVSIIISQRVIKD